MNETQTEQPEQTEKIEQKPDIIRLFHAKIAGKMPVRWFSDLFDGARYVLDEIYLILREDKMHLRQLNTGKTTILQLEFERQFFTEYEYHAQGQEITACIDGKAFKEVLKRAKKNIEINITGPADLECNKTPNEIKICPDNRGKMYLEPLTPPEDRAKRPDLSFDASFRIISEELHNLIDDAASVASHLKLGVKHDEELDNIVTVYAEGDTGKCIRNIEQGENMKELYFTNEFETMYAIGTNLLNAFPYRFVPRLKSCKYGTWVDVFFSKDKPLQMVIEHELGFILTFILAPRVERR